MKTIYQILLLFSLFLLTFCKEEIAYKFYFFSEECFETFFTRKDFLNPVCLKLTISRGLSFSIVGLSIILKLPQILKIFKNQSVEGLSFSGLIAENVLLVFVIAYNFFIKSPFSLFGENIFIVIQNVFMSFLFLKYDKQLSAGKFWTVIILFLISTGGLFVGAFTFQPPNIFFDNTILISMLLTFLSKFSQIKLNFENSSTGQLAFITTFLQWSGTVARGFTVFTESKDFLSRANSLQNIVLNSVLVSQFAFYWNKTSSQMKSSQIHVTPDRSIINPKKPKAKRD